MGTLHYFLQTIHNAGERGGYNNAENTSSVCVAHSADHGKDIALNSVYAISFCHPVTGRGFLWQDHQLFINRNMHKNVF